MMPSSLETSFSITNKVDWQTSFREAFRSSSDLFRFLENEQAFNEENYPIFVPRKLAEKIKKRGPNSALWKQFIPSQIENSPNDLGLYDPIGDLTHSKGSGIIHRYKNRLLFSPTLICPVNCRYCFRKNELADREDALKGRLEKLIEYIDANSQVEEVILTGGDPLMLSNQRLELILNALAGKVEYIRFHSRVPVILPERIDSELLGIIKKANRQFSVVSLAIHANHQEEFDEENSASIKNLTLTGTQLLSQSVLLKDVNNSAKDLIGLYKQFAKLGVKAYYLHHPDQVRGAMHFSLPLAEGRKLYSSLRDNLPGWAIPHYIIDPENGQGKNLAYNPESIKFSGKILDRFNHTHQVSR